MPRLTTAAIGTSLVLDQAERGDVISMARMYESLRHGIGRPRDDAAAISWLRRAAEAGHPSEERFCLGAWAAGPRPRHDMPLLRVPPGPAEPYGAPPKNFFAGSGPGPRRGLRLALNPTAAGTSA